MPYRLRFTSDTTVYHTNLTVIAQTFLSVCTKVLVVISQPIKSWSENSLYLAKLDDLKPRLYLECFAAAMKGLGTLIKLEDKLSVPLSSRPCVEPDGCAATCLLMSRQRWLFMGCIVIFGDIVIFRGMLSYACQR